MNACVQNSPHLLAQNRPSSRALVVQALAHTDGVDGPDLVNMLLQRLYHGVESQVWATINSRFERLVASTMLIASRVVQAMGFRPGQPYRPSAVVQMRSCRCGGDDRHCIHLGITKHI
jgi:hypothetical protein